MEFNQLPDDFDSEQKRQTEFDSREAKLTFDAKNLIELARKRSRRLGVKVDPTHLIQRADDDVYALCAAIFKEEKQVTANTAAPSAPESVEVDPRLTTFWEDFDADPALKSKISWAEIQTRLLANEGHYLALAQAMEQGGQLFGVDKQGNPLISDRGDEPVMKGMNYKNTRDRVLWKHDRNDIQGKMIIDEAGKSIATGYEMFPYVGDYGKSDEIKQYETHTGKHFVQSPDQKEWRSSWLESGKHPSWPRNVSSRLRDGDSSVGNDYPYFEYADRGVRRLLRVEKAA